MVRRAIIPAAGLGTRMRPFSDVVPKELAPLGAKPAIQFAIDEALAAGIEEIVIVASPAKQLLREYVVRFGDPTGQARFAFVEQKRMLGLGDAMTRCRELVGREPFAMLLPDNVLLAPEHRFARLIEAHERTGGDVLGIVEVTERESGRYGNCGVVTHEPVSEGLLRLTALADKQPGRFSVGPGERVLRNCGRYVLRAEFLDVIESLRGAIEGELDEVPATQHVIAERGAWGVLLPQPLFDVGHPEGLLAASAALLGGSARGRETWHSAAP